MTPEELLKPRVIVENKWPGCEFEGGDILTMHERGFYWIVEHGNIPVKEIEPYPYLMRPLQWWEERSKKEMPEYLKDIGDGEIFKVREWLDNSMAVIWLNKNKKMNHTGFHQANAEHFTPATESEYNEYINRVKS